MVYVVSERKRYVPCGLHMQTYWSANISHGWIVQARADVNLQTVTSQAADIFECEYVPERTNHRLRGYPREVRPCI